MFLGYSIGRPISIKNAHHIKLPYAKHKVNFSTSKLVPYGGIYNLIYGLDKQDVTTYFYIKNNTIYYHRKLFGEPQFFWIDYRSNEHKLIEFRSLKYNIGGLENLLIKTDKGKWYVISDGVGIKRKKKYLALIDATTGRELFMAS